VYKAAASDDPMQRKPVIDKAKQILNWEPGIQLREGLMRTIEYFETIINTAQEEAMKGKVIYRNDK
jgi:UDP-glucuronate decarboxylase